MKRLPFSWLALVGGLIALLSSLRFPDGTLGHDYSHAFARLLIGAAHFRASPLSLPHFTAALCGGEPFLADPQSTYFSLPQWLTFAIDPETAAFLTIAVFATLGYFGFLTLIREALGDEGPVAHFISLAFLLNGFSYAHLLVGHLTHHGYFLAPWILRPLFRRHESLDGRWWADVAALTLLGLYLLYSGGLHVLVVMAFLILVALPGLVWRHAGALGPFVLLITGAATLWWLGGAGKIYAGWSYSPVFWPQEIDPHPFPAPQALQTFFWFTPEATPQVLTFGKSLFGAWEYVGFVTKLTIPALVALTFFVAKRKETRVAALATATLAGVTVLVALAKLGNVSVPAVRSYHNPVKILGCFLPLLLLALAWALGTLRKVLRDWQPEIARAVSSPWLFLIAVGLLVGEFHQNAAFLRRIPEAGGFPSGTAPARALPPIEKITEKGGDLEALFSASTSLACYEPLFGYRLEGYKAELFPGPTSEGADGYFNLTHPGCLIYPGHFGCRRWERVPESERQAFEDLIHWRQPRWSLPSAQTRLYGLSAVTIFFCLGLAVMTRRPSPRAERA